MPEPMGHLDYAEAHVRSALDGDCADENLSVALEFIQHARTERDELRAEVERLTKQLECLDKHARKALGHLVQGDRAEADASLRWALAHHTQRQGFLPFDGEVGTPTPQVDQQEGRDK